MTGLLQTVDDTVSLGSVGKEDRRVAESGGPARRRRRTRALPRVRADVVVVAARREERGLLTELGAPPLRSVRTVGGGAANPAWMEMRAQLLRVPMLPPVNLEAGYGAALLARGRL